jgi:palmitoyl-protein thioesterase
LQPFEMYLALLLACIITPAVSFVVYPQAFLSVDQSQPLSVASASVDNDTPLPLVIWHGLGDRFDADGLKDVAALANEVNPGTYVHIIKLADDGTSDRTASFFGNLTEQIDLVCKQLAEDPILSTAPAIDALGFSQGGQFLRGYVERCNNPPVRNLVTFGSQHNGIAEFQRCKSATDLVCQGANALLRSGTWSSFVQSRLVPAQYFRNLDELDSYLESSNYLADINNERPLKNQTYKKNLSSLNKFVMFVFNDDKTVIPKETGWFAEVNTTSEQVTLLKDRPIYKEDWLGLKTLDEKGGLIFETLKGGHMKISRKELRRVMTTYFGPATSEARKEEWREVSGSPQVEL